ncbi:uncharacterized protein LOC120474786 isoform X1 [Pimephales promelas]|uniref:uncharacterized protein LOC120474786 isoform X1 n=1 Tax=Pimephales promelas TaxID=90988 RepID=UPI001955A9DE|nr:uncharacterized protein LOC120474786 isoform X1 [Pimephales promelas]XP_039521343.1 uncharacterized protein LOC120474786 isoform X1 [Pimephales promelas]
MKTMNAVNAVQLFIVVWTFTAVCQADDDISVNCEDVTGTVRKEVTLTCSVSLKKSGCCFTVYKFQYPERYNDPTICREKVPPGSCEQRNSFTCRFTPTTVMMEQFRFFIATDCGTEQTKFTVNITETSKHEPVIEDPGKKERNSGVPEESVVGQSESSKNEKVGSRGFKVAVIAAAVSCFIIVVVPIIYKMKQNYKQKRKFLDNNPENHSENMI